MQLTIEVIVREKQQAEEREDLRIVLLGKEIDFSNKEGAMQGLNLLYWLSEKQDNLHKIAFPWLHPEE